MNFKEAIEKSTKAMHTLEEKVEEISDKLSDNASEMWGDLKKNFSDMRSKLENASENFSKAGDETTLEAHLGAMEAREKLEGVKEDMEDFTSKLAHNTEATFDRAKLQAHLAKMEAEDFWEKKGKGISTDFYNSKESVEKMAVTAIDEITSFFDKLSSHFSDKKS